MYHHITARTRTWLAVVCLSHQAIAPSSYQHRAKRPGDPDGKLAPLVRSVLHPSQYTPLASTSCGWPTGYLPGPCPGLYMAPQVGSATVPAQRSWLIWLRCPPSPTFSALALRKSDMLLHTMLKLVPR